MISKIMKNFHEEVALDDPTEEEGYSSDSRIQNFWK